MNITKVICTGRLTKDPELRKISEEMSVCQLRLAVDEACPVYISLTAGPTKLCSSKKLPRRR